MFGFGREKTEEDEIEIQNSGSENPEDQAAKGDEAGEDPEVEDVTEDEEPRSGLNRETVSYILEKIFFFGTLGLLLVALGYLGYHGVINWREAKNRPQKVSIESLNIGQEPIESPAQSGTQRIVEVVEEKKAEKTAEKSPAELAVRVLNGSGVAGAAGKLKDFLVSKGYTKTETGNAESSNVIGTTVFYGQDRQVEAEKLLKAIQEKYPKAGLKQAVSVEEKGSELVIIVGK